MQKNNYSNGNMKDAEENDISLSRNYAGLEQNTDFNILGIIRYSKKVAENTFLRKPIYEYSPCCAAAQGYKKFVTAYTGKAR